MSYIALYRKFRPATFDDVKGQDNIVRALQNQIKSGRIAHAYLFSGTRGTGKTSVARIFAKAVNCENNTSGNPCGKCSNCIDFEQGRAFNIIEIDAASNNGVDQMRALRDEVGYPPTTGKYKVYIIDEAHMLSQAAFNALLKTLEEPPEYVIFILATTSSEKIIPTIISRCQKYDFKRISVKDISFRISELIKEEKIDITDEAIEYIARRSDGSLRDGLSILDQCISVYINERIDVDKIIKILGVSTPDIYQDMLVSIYNGDIAASLSILDDILQNGIEINIFISDFILYIRNVMLSKSEGINPSVLNLTEEDFDKLKKVSKETDTQRLIYYIELFGKTLNNTRSKYAKRTLLEIDIVKACIRNDNSYKPDAIITRQEVDDSKLYVINDEIQKLKEQIKTLTEGGAIRDFDSIKKSNKKDEKQKPKLSGAIPDDIKEFITNKDEIIKTFDNYDQIYLRKAKYTLGDNGNLKLVFKDSIIGNRVIEKKEEFENAFSEAYGKRISIDVELLEKNISFEDKYADIDDYINMEIVKENE